MKIVVCGGHVTPALAVINALTRKIQNPKSKIQNFEILFIGRKHATEGDRAISAEYKLITELGIPFKNIFAGRLQRKFTRYTIPALLKIPVGFWQAFGYLLKFRPQIILSFGGYLALPVVLVGWLLRIPTVTHEQTTVSGLANRIIAYFAKKICLSWPQSVTHYPANKVVLTGNPVRKEIFKKEAKTEELKEFLQNYTLGPRPYPLIYITGGNQGAHVINEAVSEVLEKLLKDYFVVHQTGDSQIYKDYEKISNLKSLPRRQAGQISKSLQERYFLTKYIKPQDIGAVLNSAALVVSRAGANIVSELAALGKTAIFIPIPFSEQDEQTKNAQILVEAGTAEILPQKDLTGESLCRYVDTSLQNIEKYQKNAPVAKKLVDLSAAEKVAEEVLKVVTS